MEQQASEISNKPFPFNNLYLISGFISGLNQGWTYLLTLLLTISGYVLFQSVILFPLMAILMENGYSQETILQNANLLFDYEALKLDRNIVLALELGMFVVAFFGFYSGIRFIQRKTLVSILTGYEKFRFKRFYFAFALWGILLTVSVVIDYLVHPDSLRLNFQWSGFLISTLIMLVLMPIQTGLEELVFRGYLLQGLALIFKNGVVPLVITSVLFGMAHLSNPEVKEFGWPIMLTYYIGFALFMGALTLLDEGLELAFGIHFANNLISSILINSQTSVIKTYSIFESKTENPFSEIIIWFGMAVLCFAIFKLKYKWKNFSLIIK